MPVKIVDEKSCHRVSMHPLQHTYQVFIGKMMAEQRRKNNRGLCLKINCIIIRMNKCCVEILTGFRGNCDTVRIDINPHKRCVDVIFPAPSCDRFEIIASAAPDFANYSCRMSWIGSGIDELFYSVNCYGMTP